MNKSTKKLVAGGVTAGTLMLGAAGLVIGVAVAKADTTDMTSREIAFANQTGEITCTVFEKYPTAGGLLMENGNFTPYEAGQIVGYSITKFCPEELPSVMRAAKGAAGADNTAFTTVSYTRH